MVVEGHTEREEWIAEVKAGLLAKLLSDARFRDGVKLTDRFQREVEIWNRTGTFRPVIEIANELAAAERLLNTLNDGECLTYELPMAGTKKRIDFLKLSRSGQHEWTEVKNGCPGVGERRGRLAAIYDDC